MEKVQYSKSGQLVSGLKRYEELTGIEKAAEIKR